MELAQLRSLTRLNWFLTPMRSSQKVSIRVPMALGHSDPKARTGLDISAAEDGYVVYQPELDRVHHLNHSAVLILELCTGRNSMREIASLIQEAYSLPDPPFSKVEETVANLLALGLLESNRCINLGPWNQIS